MEIATYVFLWASNSFVFIVKAESGRVLFVYITDVAALFLVIFIGSLAGLKKHGNKQTE